MSKVSYKRLVSQALILGLIFTSGIAICDALDKSTSEKHTAKVNKAVKPITYTSSATEIIPEYKPEITGFSIVSGTVSIAGHETPNIVRVDSDVVADEKNVDSSSIVEKEYESLELPQGDCSAFLYMDYRAITNTASKQWKLQQSAWTDNQGFRRIGDDYCVALGTFYGQVGDRFRVTTDRGNVYSVIQADAKGWDSNGWYHVAGDGRINLVEFIVQTECLPSEVTFSGDCGVLDNIGGNVIKIERIV